MGRRGRGPSPGTQLGPYRIVRTLGEGGFGIVDEAEQSRPVRRTVALKLLKPGVAGDEVLSRFEDEREALARMEHPSVAKVLDAGVTEGGRPYFAMEFVRGEPILKLADSANLGIRDRLPHRQGHGRAPGGQRDGHARRRHDGNARRAPRSPSSRRGCCPSTRRTSTVS